MAEKRKPHYLETKRGPIVRQLLALSLPTLVSLAFQVLFVLADLFIARRYASPGVADAIRRALPLPLLATGFSVVLGTGFSVVAGQHFGAHDRHQLEQAVHTAVTLALVLGVFCAAAGFFGAPHMLHLIGADTGTGPRLTKESLAYLRVFLGATVLPIVCETEASLLRAVGNTRTPALVAALACLTNAGLDLLVARHLSMGARGFAFAGCGAHLIACAIMTILLIRVRGPWRLRPALLKISPTMAKAMLASALPLAAQYGALLLSALLARRSFATFGPQMARSWNLALLLCTPAWLVSLAQVMALTVFSAQNFGAAGYGRMKRGLHLSLVLSLLLEVAMTALAYAGTPQCASLLGADAATERLIVTMVMLMAPSLLVYTCMDNIAATIRGTGESLRSALFAIACCGLHALLTLGVVPRHHSIFVAAATFPLACLVTMLLFVIYFRHGRWLSRALHASRPRRHRRARHTRQRGTHGRHAHE